MLIEKSDNFYYLNLKKIYLFLLKKLKKVCIFFNF